MTVKKAWPVIFFGSEENSLLVLKRIATFPFLKVTAVVTPPPQPQGRKRIITPTPVHLWAQEQSIKVFSPPSITNEIIKAIKKEKPQLGILAAYGKIIPSSLIKIFPKGIINIHPSLLPQWRGPTPVETALLSGAQKTGVSLFLLDEKIDHGPLLVQKRIKISPQDNQLTLSQQLFNQGAALLKQHLKAYLQGQIKPSPQNHHQATYTRKLSRQDGFINSEDLQKALRGSPQAIEIERKIRALYPWPGTYTLVGHPSPKRLKILKARLSKDKKLILTQIQLEGKQPLSSPQSIKPLLKRFSLLS